MMCEHISEVQEAVLEQLRGQTPLQ
jgi:hypothetical protein